MSRRKYVLEDQVGFMLRKANQRHRTIFSRMITPKVAPAQLATLVKLGTDGPIHQNRLGRLVAMDSATITGVVNRLAQRGWVRSGPDDDDARLSVIDLTEAGRLALDLLLPQAAQITKATLSPLNADESKTFLALLKRLAD